MNIDVQAFAWTYVFKSLWSIPRHGTANLNSDYAQLFEEMPEVSHNSTFPLVHEQVLIPLHPCQQLSFPGCLFFRDFIFK